MLLNELPMVWAEIDLGRLRGNLRAVRSALHAGRTRILAVVKADAYGHGMGPVARALRSEGVRFFGVANIGEALELRRFLKRERILVFGSFHESEVRHYIRSRITPTVSSFEDVHGLESELAPCARAFPVHVKIDTGMGRLGVWHADTEDFFRRLRPQKKIFVEGVYTHFSSADEADRSFTQRQIRLFNRSVQKIKSLGFSPLYLHAANSLGLARFNESHLNLVRPGILLYGVLPGGVETQRAASLRRLRARLRPVLSLKTRISFLKEVEKGRTLSYGATYRVPSRTKVATLPVGYSHGYRWGFSNKGFVAIRGKKCPIIGRVTMDQTLVDVGSAADVERWDEVTLIGRDREVEVSACDLARFAGTIPYEIFCSLHSCIPRIYKGF